MMTLMSRIVAERQARESEAAVDEQASRDAEWERIEANRCGLFRAVADEFQVELIETQYTSDRMEFQRVGWRVWPVGWQWEDSFRLVYEHPDVWYLAEKPEQFLGEFARLYGPDGWEGEDVRDFLFRRYEAWRAAHPEEAAELEKRATRPAHVSVVAPLNRYSGKLPPLHLAMWLPDKVLDELAALARHLQQNRPLMGDYLSHRMTKVTVDTPGVLAWIAGWESSQPEIEDIPECGMLLPTDGGWEPRPPLDPMSKDRLNMTFEVRDDGMLTVEDEDGNWATIDLFELVMDVEEARAR